MPRLSPLKTLRPTTTQIERLKKEPIGSGFLVFRADEDRVEVVPFVLGVSGQLLNPDGSPLTFTMAGDITLYTVVPNLDKSKETAS